MTAHQTEILLFSGIQRRSHFFPLILPYTVITQPVKLENRRQNTASANQWSSFLTLPLLLLSLLSFLLRNVVVDDATVAGGSSGFSIAATAAAAAAVSVEFCCC